MGEAARAEQALDYTFEASDTNAMILNSVVGTDPSVTPVIRASGNPIPALAPGAS